VYEWRLTSSVFIGPWTYDTAMEILKDLSPSALAVAVEENEAEFLLALGRAGGGEERDDDEIAWTIGGSPIGYHNCVVRAELTRERADDEIAASIAAFERFGVAGSWHVGPSMRPSDLGERLGARGFQGAPEPGMAVDLHALAPPPPVAGLRVDRVTSPADLTDYERVLGSGFGEGPVEAAWVCAMYARIRLDNDAWRHHIGRIDDRAVATASVFFAAGVAGLYFVSTAPEMRRRGIGAAVSYAAMADARDAGYRVGVLGSSPMGHAVYERLGFREVCEITVHEWSPRA
jgi:GNAT superfamily N-acetyltransferase